EKPGAPPRTPVPKLAKLRGNVRAASGSDRAPVKNATIRIVEWNTETQSRDDGSFELEGPPRPVRLIITARPLYRDGQTYLYIPAGGLRKDFLLRPTDYVRPKIRIVTGVVRVASLPKGAHAAPQDWDKALPVRDAEIRIAGKSTKTGPDGRFSIE